MKGRERKKQKKGEDETTREKSERKERSKGDRYLVEDPSFLFLFFFFVSSISPERFTSGVEVMLPSSCSAGSVRRLRFACSGEGGVEGGGERTSLCLVQKAPRPFHFFFFPSLLCK